MADHSKPERTVCAIVGLCVFVLPPRKGKLNMHANDLQVPNFKKRRKNAKRCQREQQGKPHKDPLSLKLLQINFNCKLETHRNNHKWF